MPERMDTVQREYVEASATQCLGHNLPAKTLATNLFAQLGCRHYVDGCCFPAVSLQQHVGKIVWQEDGAWMALASIASLAMSLRSTSTYVSVCLNMFAPLPIRM